MIRLTEIDEENWLSYRKLAVGEEQRGFLDSAAGILARGYVYRSSRARIFGIAEGETAVGLALVRDLEEEPSCYDLQQFMIDARFQGRGCGSRALGLILDILKEERRFDCTEVCVKKSDAGALRLYEKAGFADTGYTDPDLPDCLILRLRFG